MNGWSRLPCPLKENSVVSSVELTRDKKPKQNTKPRNFSKKSKQTTWAPKKANLGHIV